MSSNLVCNEGQRVSPYSPRQSLALFMEDSTNYCCQKQCQNFHSSSQIRCKCFIVVELLLLHLNTLILKGVKQRLTSTLEHICAFYVEITNIHRVKLKMSGFVVTMQSGLCKKYVKFLGLSALGFDFLFRMRPCALWQQTSAEPVLIP